MKKDFKYLSVLSLLMISSFSYAEKAQIDLQQSVKTFLSPNNITEQCIALAKLPLGDYKEKDTVEEKRLCDLDIYNNTVALCPKIWSTSPGTIFSGFTGLAQSSQEAEAAFCKNGSPLKTLAKFKQTINQFDTSGTFSGSSILYYHFSRALNTAVTVPVAVYRSMDKNIHYARVSSKANPPSSAKMNLAGWNWIKQSEQSPDFYKPTTDLYTSDKKQIYGVLLKDKGERYGYEINGTRKSGWGKGQNFDFQKTPAFLALKSKQNLEAAIQEGFNQAIQDPLMKSAFLGRPSTAQMVLWMNEVSEIAILDYIFSQQDRIGNIDYQWYWAYVDEKGVQAQKVEGDQYESLSRLKMNQIPVPAELSSKNPILIQKTSIGDNDAGGLIQYGNYTKATGMLDGFEGVTGPMTHLNKETYQRLLQLANDFSNKGSNYQALAKEVTVIGYNDAGNKRFNQLIGNTILAARIFQKNCQNGILKLDLVSFKKAMVNDFTTEPTNCALEP